MSESEKTPSAAGQRKVRYAVVGQGHIAQVAVLPAFAHAGENSELAALVSEDPVKRDELSEKYGVGQVYSYAEYERCLSQGGIDAVYIALPNHLHAEFTIRAADAGLHVLCEKPMAVTEAECEAMIEAAERNKVKLMIAYRLHFEEANLQAIELARSGRLGRLRMFNSLFTQQVVPGNIRVLTETGGGTLYDIGIYCINAARYLFQDEPIEVFATTAGRRDEVEEMTSAILHFPDERLAAFTCSFGAADVSAYQLVGTEGDLRVDPAYEYAGALKHQLTLGDKKEEHTFEKRDQFAPELLYFSNCILNDQTPEPSGREGLADVRVIRALYHSAQTGKPIKLPSFERQRRPSPTQEIYRPPIEKPEVIHAEAPSGAD